MAKLYKKDILNFITHLTPRRVWNALLLVSSYFLSKYLKRPIQWGYPMTLSFEPTTACNLRCPECPSGLRSFSRTTGNLKEDFFRKTIDQVSKKLIYLIFYFQGEPYINPKFLQMVKYANKKGLYTITSTNGHFLDKKNCVATVESRLDRIIISIDGTTQETYEQYRIGGNLSQVIEGAKRMVATKREMKSVLPHIVFQFLVVKPNEHQIKEIYSLANNIGVDEVKLKTAQIYDYKEGHSLIPTIEKYSRYKKQSDGTYALKYSLVDHCWKLWHACVITWNGIVVPCCFDKDAKHRLGDVNNNDFVDIWKGEAFNAFRAKVLKGRKEIDICQNCSEGCKVWA